jgi:hypothetical protein
LDHLWCYFPDLTISQRIKGKTENKEDAYFFQE